MDLIYAMRVFARVAEVESFTRAAQQLDVSVPVVTRSIASLEEHLDVRLFNRTTRRVALSEAGQSYLEGCRGVLDQIEDIESNVARSATEARGALRVVSSAAFGLTRLAPVFASYREKYPGIALQVTLLDRPVDMIEEGYDVGIVADYMVKSETLVMRPIATFERFPVATPAYLARFGTPKTPGDLETHAFLAPSNDVRTRHWTFTNGDEQTRVHLTPVFSSNSPLMLHKAVLEGMGFAILPAVLVQQDLESGALIRLHAPSIVQDADIGLSLIYPSRRLVTRRARTFIDHMSEIFL